MLGVLKRRLKPKRATTEKEKQNRKCVHSKSEQIVPVDVARITPSPRQIHPLFQEKVQLLAYDGDGINLKKSTPTPSLKKSPDEPIYNPFLPFSKKLPVEMAAEPVEPVARQRHFLRRSNSPHPSSKTTQNPGYVPAPNICVEGGRIEFVKSPSEGSNLAALDPLRASFDKKAKAKARLSQSGAVPLTKKFSGETRAQQTQADPRDFEEFSEEKCDLAKEFLEARIKELQWMLESEQKTVQKDKLTITRLQRQLARREAVQRDVDRERRLRTDTESRLRETASESERYRTTLAGLQREFSKMEDTVRTMLQYKSRCELLNQEKVFLTAAYESRVHQYQTTITKLGQENDSLKQKVRLLESTGTEELPSALLERLKALESENAHLSKDADFQRKQYERCLDDIANQVVRALLSQKGLREEIGNLQRRIKELENQNNALANILVTKFESKGTVIALPSADAQKNPFWLPGSFSMPINNTSQTANIRETVSSTSVGCKNEDRKRLRRLHFSDFGSLGEKKVVKSLNSFDSLVVVPIQRQRPRSLNFQFQSNPQDLASLDAVTSKRNQYRKTKINSVNLSKKADDEGNESPESGNRDEGYSTMSSDIQGPGETSELSKRELEDLKEASDETEIILDTNGDITSIAVEESSNPDMFFIPVNFSLSINPRYSYPPYKNFIPLQQVMRSFSDSHLCLKLTAGTPIPSPLPPSMFLVDFIDKNHPLRRTKASSSLVVKMGEENDFDDTQSNAGSWCSGIVEGCWWDAEYVQYWLKLDENRLKDQQEQSEQLELEYDRTEIEEWSMSLSCEDVAKTADVENVQRVEISQQNAGNFASANNTNESDTYNFANVTSSIKGDYSKEWSDDENETGEKFPWKMTSHEGSWSSASTNNSENYSKSLNDSYFNDCSGDIDSKRSSVASDYEDDDGDGSSAVGTDFTRDFYRLVKFESTKSLASTCSGKRDNGNCDVSSMKQNRLGLTQDREMALQSVLSFIAEQQRYCHNREEEDDKTCDRLVKENTYTFSPDENYVYNSTEIKNNLDESSQIDVSNYTNENQIQSESGNDIVETRETIPIKSKIADFEPVESEFLKESATSLMSSNSKPTYKRQTSTKLPVRNFSSDTTSRKSVRNLIVEKPRSTKNGKSKVLNKSNSCRKINEKDFQSGNHGDLTDRDFLQSSPLPLREVEETADVPSKSATKVRTPSSSGKFRETGIPVSIPKKFDEFNSSGKHSSSNKFSQRNAKGKGTRIPVMSTRKPDSALVHVRKGLNSKVPVRSFTSCQKSGEPVNPTKSSKPAFSVSGSRATRNPATPPEISSAKILISENLSLHEKATTKDVIDELNRMIRKGEEVSPVGGEGNLKPLDVTCCCPTGWVHVERDIDFTDPKARANLLDVMLASSGSSGGSGNSSDSSGDDPVDYTHLHKLHRFHRQRQASATKEQLGVLRYSLSSVRPSILERENFFVRYGDKEKEAIASFAFLEEILTTSASGCSSSNSLGSNPGSCLKYANTPPDFELSPSEMCSLITPTTPMTTPSDDSDERVGGPVSFSDSCADSYSESVGSLEDPSNLFSEKK